MRILVVEDHEDTLAELERFLVRCGHEVTSAIDLRSGLMSLETHIFDAIVCDIALPDGTGYALISEARRRGSTAIGIALSAYRYPRNSDDPTVTGFNYYLKKPLDSDLLKSLLESRERHVPGESDPG